METTQQQNDNSPAIKQQSQSGTYILIGLLCFILGGMSVYFFLQRFDITPKGESIDPGGEIRILPEEVPPPLERDDTLLPTPRDSDSVQTSDAEQPDSQNQQQLDELAIKLALAKRHSRTVEETTMSISKNTGSYATGGVKFAGDIGGGMYLAAKVNGIWIIADDGNGVPMCEATDPYNFPVDMLPNCSNNDGTIRTR